MNILISSLHKTVNWTFVEMKDTNWVLTAVEPVGTLFMYVQMGPLVNFRICLWEFDLSEVLSPDLLCYHIGVQDLRRELDYVLLL